MSAELSQSGMTALRALELRTRTLSLEAQMMECVDLLQAPEFVIEDLVHSIEQIREEPKDGRVDLVGCEAPDPSAFFYPSRELFVQGDRCSFTCLGTELSFRSSPAVEAKSEATPESTPASDREIDYAAVTCESRPFPALGFTQSAESESAYPLLLRALSSMIELTRPRRFDLLDREIYRGLLGPAPMFDITLVLWDDDEEPDARRPLCEFSRDLAEVLKRALAAEPRFPPILNDIVCLRMNQKRFDGRLRFVWRV